MCSKQTPPQCSSVSPCTSSNASRNLLATALPTQLLAVALAVAVELGRGGGSTSHSRCMCWRNRIACGSSQSSQSAKKEGQILQQQLQCQRKEHPQEETATKLP